MTDSAAKRFLSVPILQRIKEKETFCTKDGRILQLRRLYAHRNKVKDAPNRIRAGVRPFHRLAAKGRCKSRKNGKRWLLFVESRILRVAQPARCQRGSRRREFRRAAAEIHHHGVQRSHFGSGGFLFARSQQLRRRRIEIRKAASYDWALHNPRRGKIFFARPKRGVV